MEKRETFVQRRWIAWLTPWRRRPGYWAFVLHRLTGLGLVVYLGIHLYVLRLLNQGPDAWDAFIRLAQSPLFWALDGVLFFGLLYHALNGVRVTLLALGWGLRYQRQGFWWALTLSALLTVASLWLFVVR